MFLMQATNSVETLWKMGIIVKFLTVHFLRDIFSPKIFTQTDPQGSKGPAEEPLVLLNSIGRNEKFWDRWVPGTAL